VSGLDVLKNLNLLVLTKYSVVDLASMIMKDEMMVH